MPANIKMPDLGTTVDSIELLRWLVEEGAVVKRGQPLAEVQTDKATMEIESIVSGRVTSLTAQAGQSIEVGQVIAVIDDGSVDTAAAPKPAAPPAAKSSPASPPRSTSSPAAAPTAHATKPSWLGKKTSPQAASAPAAPAPLPGAGSYDRATLLRFYEQMQLIRQFEERVRLLFLEGDMPGTIHQCQGQEACAVGVCQALRGDDMITSTHRPHGHALAKGLTAKALLAELYGKVTGCCRGKGGSMHVGDMTKGMLPAIAIVGGAIPVAAGMGLAFRMQKKDRVVACFFGDGAVNEGAFHEGVNLAAIWDAPVIFVCENNLYGASTAIENTMRVETIAERGAGYGVPSQRIDGNDVLAVYEATRAAAAACREGKGPVLLELMTYRRTGHSRRDPCHYQPKDEKDQWFQRDPIELFKKVLLARDVKETDLTAIDAKVEREIEEAVQYARQSPEPAGEELTRDVFA